MPKLIDREIDQRFIALFVGRKGCGKTVAEASFRQNEDQIIEIHDFDGRIGGIDGAAIEHNPKGWITKKNIDYYYYPPRPKIGPGPYDQLMSRLDTLQVMGGAPGAVMPTTLVIDSMTSTAETFLQQAAPLTHEGTKGRSLGSLDMFGPADYGFESQAMHNVVAQLRSIKIPNIIVSAHIVPRWGKAPGADPYSENIIVGEQLLLRPKIGESIQIYFDHIFRFDRNVVGNDIRFNVTFRSDLATTSFAKLPNGPVDITELNLYQYIQEKIK